MSYNTKALTLECLASVLANTRLVSFEVIVWDNASSDGSASAIEDRFGEKVNLVRSDVNLGFAAANNRAAELACGDFLLLLNPDTVVLDGAIDQLLAFADLYPSAGIWGGRTFFEDGSLNTSSCWGRQSLWSLFCQASGLSVALRRTDVFNPEGMGGWNREGIRNVDIVSGCFLMIRKNLWTSLNGFREEFFMYGEEADLCLRAQRLGARPMVTSAASIIHHGGASERVFADKIVMLLRAKLLLVRFHFPPRLQTTGRILLFLWPVRRYLTHALLALAGRRSSRESRDSWLNALTRYEEWW